MNAFFVTFMPEDWSRDHSAFVSEIQRLPFVVLGLGVFAVDTDEPLEALFERLSECIGERDRLIVLAPLRTISQLPPSETEWLQSRWQEGEVSDGSS